MNSTLGSVVPLAMLYLTTKAGAVLARLDSAYLVPSVEHKEKHHLVSVDAPITAQSISRMVSRKKAFHITNSQKNLQDVLLSLAPYFASSPILIILVFLLACRYSRSR